jgi:hypothetical protein
MRYIPKALLALVFALLVLGAGATRDDPAFVYNTDTVSVAFDDTYTTANVTVTRIDAEVQSEAGVVVSTWTFAAGQFSVVDGAYKLPIRTQATTLANGLYRARVRVWDGYGNVSAWSETLWVSKQWRTIPAPGGCRTVSA